MSEDTLRALVIEDSASWQQILAEILSDAGLAVDVVDTYEGAVAALRATPHRLAVVDLSLRGDDYNNQDGLRVLEAVRRLDPGCVPVMLTGFATVDLAVDVLTTYQAFTCLRKEAFDRAEFAQVVQQVLAQPPVQDGEGGAAVADDEALPRLALVVEDDAGWRGILAELLSDTGFTVHTCTGYGEALGNLRREQYTLAVIDLSLADGSIDVDALGEQTPAVEAWDGYRLLASVRAGGTPVIVVSGVASPEDIERAYQEHGLFAFVQKQTFDRQAFLRIVAEAREAALAADELEDLTDREREALTLLAQGMTNKEIAAAMVISTNTVKRHLKAIFYKLDVHTRSAAVAKAVEAGLSGADG